MLHELRAGGVIAGTVETPDDVGEELRYVLEMVGR
jgi:hypothetical protein